MTTDTIPARLLEQARVRPAAPAYYIREDGIWKATSWSDYAKLVKQAGRALIALGMTAAGATLSFKPHARRVSGALLLGAVAVAVAFFAWPGRGEAPIRTVMRAIAVMDELPGFAWQLGMGLLAVMALWPAIIALLGLWHLRTPASDDHPLDATQRAGDTTIAISSPRASLSSGWSHPDRQRR